MAHDSTLLVSEVDIQTPPHRTGARLGRAGKGSLASVRALSNLAAVPRALTLDKVWAAAALLGVFIFLDLKLIAPNDFWWHIKAGELIVTGRALPTTDLFSFTQAGQPWVYQSWLAEIVLYQLYQWGGPPLVIFTHAIVITAAFALLFSILRRAAGGNLRLAAMLLLIAAVLSLDNSHVRPQTFSFPLFALTLYLLERYRRGVFHVRAGSVASQRPARATIYRGNRSLWALPGVMLLWANVHGAFIFGLLLIGLFFLGGWWDRWRSRRLFTRRTALELTVACLSGLTTLLTPLGLGMIDYVLGFLQHDVTRTLNTEFQPATIRGLSGAGLIAVCLLLAVALIRSRRQVETCDALPLVVFGLLGFYTVRTVSWFGMVATPLLAATLASRPGKRRSRPGHARLNTVLLAGFAVLALLSLPWLRPHLPLPEVNRGYLLPGTPVQATDALCQRTSERPIRLFADMAYASYVEWACPAAGVFVDTRIEQYPEEQWLDYLALSNGRYDWEKLLDRYGVTHLMLRFKTQGPLVNAVQQSPGWQELYRDQDGALFVRRSSES